VNFISFAEDVAFIENFIDLIQLTDAANQSKVAVSATMQGRAMDYI
jgi:hypothetical protein